MARPTIKVPKKPMISPADRADRLAAFGLVIAKRRDEAVHARKDSGIEAVWLEAEEAYLGIDDVNRHEYTGAKWAKPTSMEGPVTTGGIKGATRRSTAFVRLTSRYVDAGAAKLGEILLPIDDKPFSIKPTPIPDLIKGKDDLSPLLDENGANVMRPASPEEQQAAAQNNIVGHPPSQVPMSVADKAKAELAKADDAAKKAEKRIEDWLIECGHSAEMRKVIHDAARIGVGVLKGPVPKEQQAKAISAKDGRVVLQIEKKITPATKWMDPWNAFPDPACGENIQDGDFFIERDYLSPRSLRKLGNLQGYDAAQIAKVLEQGPGKIYEKDGRPNQKVNKKRFEVWYYYGSIGRDDLGIVDESLLKGLSEGKTEVYAILTLVNDCIIRASINPMESGEFPYHAVPWSRRSGHWAGVGVSEQVRMPQRMVNAATRALLNNAGKSAGSQIIMDKKGVVPADGNYEITPDKLWFKLDDSVLDDVRKAFFAVEFPSMQPQLMAIIEYGFRLAEEATNIPLISQGQSGATTPDTLGATQIQNNNANQLLRSVAYSVDDHITNPVIRQFYEWLLLDTDVPDEEKGDFQINAHGSVALVERAIQDQTIGQMGSMVLNPSFGVNPKLWFGEFMKSKHLNPKNFQYTEEEQKQLESQQQPVAPAVQAAQIRVASDEKIAQAEIQSKEKIAVEAARAVAQRADLQGQNDLAYAEKEKEMTQIAAEGRIRELELKKEIALLEYANKKELTLIQVKADLAKSAADTQTKKDLAAAEIALTQTEGQHDRTHDLNKHLSSIANPAVQPEMRGGL